MAPRTRASKVGRTAAKDARTAAPTSHNDRVSEAAAPHPAGRERERRASPRRVADLPTPFFIAHRGMANLYPENTLEAYRGSVALGVEMVEEDCWLTRDGGLVCLHDPKVDRTT